MEGREESPDWPDAPPALRLKNTDDTEVAPPLATELALGDRC